MATVAELARGLRPGLEYAGAIARWAILGVLGFVILLLPMGEEGVGLAESHWARAIVYSLLCTGVAAMAIEGSGRRIMHLGFPWSVLAGATILVACGLVGSFLGLFVCFALGIADVRDFALELTGAMRFNLPLSLVVGGTAFVHEAMSGRLSQKEQELREREVAEARALALAAESRLSALAARIRPHFLFNTLNSIAALIPEDPARAEQMVERLSSLLRSVLDTGRRPLVRLDDELRVSEAYLEIEKVRFGSRLRWSFDVSPSLASQAVPPLSIQTLVENCVKHVVSNQKDAVTVEVTAVERAGSVLLEVNDDGPAGLDASALPSGHGLDVLRSRLASLFGSAGRLEIERASGHTCIRLAVPRQTPDEEASP